MMENDINPIDIEQALLRLKFGIRNQGDADLLAAYITQLRDEAAQARRTADDAYQCADMWQTIAERERDGHEVGLTLDGRAIDLGPTTSH